MLVVVAAGERAEAILLLGGKLYEIEDDNASAAFRFLVRGEMVKFWSGEVRGFVVQSGNQVHQLLSRLPDRSNREGSDWCT